MSLLRPDQATLHEHYRAALRAAHLAGNTRRGRRLRRQAAKIARAIGEGFHRQEPQFWGSWFKVPLPKSLFDKLHDQLKEWAKQIPAMIAKHAPEVP